MKKLFFLLLFSLSRARACLRVSDAVAPRQSSRARTLPLSSERAQVNFPRRYAFALFHYRRSHQLVSERNSREVEARKD